MMTTTYLYCTVRRGTVLMRTPTHKVGCRGIFFSVLCGLCVYSGLLVWRFGCSKTFILFFEDSWINLCVEVLRFFRIALHTYINCANGRCSSLSFVPFSLCVAGEGGNTTKE